MGYCYLPLYIFAGDHPLAAILRPSNIDASAGCLPHIERLVTRLRQAWPEVEIVLRGDSGFCREYLMRWCEAHGVHFVFGMAKNKRLLRIVGKEMHEAKELFVQTKQPARVFKDFNYCTHKSWSRSRRVVGKAEHIAGDKANPRFVVTSLSANAFDARTLYEEQYCARGDMENRIKEQQLYMFADHLCCETMRANQVRLYFSTVAYVVVRALREFGLKETPLARVAVLDHPGAVVQDRGVGAGECAAGGGVVDGGVSVAGAVRAGVGEPAAVGRGWPGEADRNGVAGEPRG